MEDNQKYDSFRIATPKVFEDFFSHFYYAANRSEHPLTKTFLPSYQTILIFNFGEKAVLHSAQNRQIKVGRCVVLGPIKQAFDYTLPVNSKIIVANFKNDAFYRFFGNASIAEGVPMNPDDLLNENCFTALWNQLNRINDINSRIDQILEFCKPYLRSSVAIAVQLKNFSDETLNPIKAIAGENSQSERNIQLSHKKHFGYSAKEMIRYQRFLKAVELMQDIASGTGKVDWFEVISKCGYYDQSQLINDFKHYISLSPTKYLKFQQDICR